MLFARRRIKPERDGTFSLKLPEEERSVLSHLAEQLSDLLLRADRAAGEDEAVDRLFPAAYSEEEDWAKDAEFRVMRGEALLDHHRGALSIIVSTAGQDRLTGEEAYAWMQALNQLRLVLGSRLGVTEEGDEEANLSEDHPAAHGFLLYHYLTMLQGELIEALAADL